MDTKKETDIWVFGGNKRVLGCIERGVSEVGVSSEGMRCSNGYSRETTGCP